VTLEYERLISLRHSSRHALYLIRIFLVNCSVLETGISCQDFHEARGPSIIKVGAGMSNLSSYVLSLNEQPK